MDSDKDGIPDDEDKCPNEAEDKDGFEDQDGCPDPDNDKDGIADASDKCPNEPETINNVEDEDGCPDKGIVSLKDGELQTLEPVFFKKDRARVRHAFWPTLDAIAALLIAHPEIGRCAVQGHSDDSGPPDWNQVLSMKRADSVVKYLVAHGVDPKRLTSIGHGDDVPWASNKTEQGRAANRRVIFHIEGVAADQDSKQLEIQKERAAKATGATLNGIVAPAETPPPIPPAPTEPVEERGPPIDRPGDRL
jgi:outer membrane protein OmpA-like peptidoglycan-associated protein